MKSRVDGTKTAKSISAIAVVPLKELDQAKSRLSSIMDRKQREQFVLSMLEDVLAAIRSSKLIAEILLVTREEDIETQLNLQEVDILADPSDRDLNSGLHAATTYVVNNHGNIPLIVIPGDVPLITESDIDAMISQGSTEERQFVVAASSDDYGTSALLRKPPAVITAEFGPASFERHKNLARHNGIPFFEYHSPRISLDIDTVDDIETLLERPVDNATTRFLHDSGLLQAYFQKS